jgi:hypothetical protein
VRRLVNRLHHRKENSLFINEADLSLVLTDDGEAVSLLGTLPMAGAGPSELLLLEGEAEAVKSGIH